MIHVVQQSSLEKIKPDAKEFKAPFNSVSAMIHESVAYQVVLYSDNEMGEVAELEFRSNIEVKLFEVRSVPVNWAHYSHHKDPSLLADGLSVLPDALFPLDEKPVLRISNRPTVLWVNIMGFGSGDYNVDLYINGEPRSRFVLKILPYTFTGSDQVHCEYIDPCSISRAHRVAMYSSEHWNLLGKYFNIAASHGVTHLLTPIYPAVYGDAPFAKDPIQLVRIKKVYGSYEFNYDLLDSWIAVAKRNGISKLIFPPLIPDLKTLACPKIKIMDDGEEVFLFDEGETVLSSKFFIFIRTYVRHLLAHLKKLEFLFDVAFQFTHAPTAEDGANYLECRSIFKGVIRGHQFADTMPTPEFVALNIGSAPFFSSARLEEFLEFPVNNHLFLDHETPGSIVNTLIAAPSTWIRSFGPLSYRYSISSLFNLWFNYCPHSLVGELNVATDTSCGNQVPCGNGFLVYPGPDGPLPSVRLKQFHFALQDLKRLICLRRMISPNRINSIIDKYFKLNGTGQGLDPEKYIEFHEEICSLFKNDKSEVIK